MNNGIDIATMEEKASALPQEVGDKASKPLPSPVSFEDFRISDEACYEPDALIEGFAHVGSKVLIAGASKAKKSWLLIDLALGLSSGSSWLEFDIPRRFKTLLIDLELQAPFLKNRIESVGEARGIENEMNVLPFDVLPLRGKSEESQDFVEKLINQVAENGYEAIIIDPLYKLSAGDENSANDMGRVMSSLEQLAVETGAAVIVAHHFSKGNQARKDHMDRASGSGVFARDPDSILTLTAHEKQDCAAFEFTVRNFHPVRSFVGQWYYPRWEYTDLDPTDLKDTRNAKKYTIENLLIVDFEGKRSGEWLELATEDCGISKNPFYGLKKQLIKEHIVTEKDGVYTYSNGNTKKTWKKTLKDWAKNSSG